MALDRELDLIQIARRQAAGVRQASSAVGAGLGAGSAALSADALPNYHLVREIHRGGQGVVYEARQISTGRTVALKVMREGPFAGPSDRFRFEREVQILASLRHPDIVSIHDSGVAGGFYYFVMDFVHGRALDEFAANRKLSVRESLDLFARICEAVNAAHLRGVIHRDLKPGNILVLETSKSPNDPPTTHARAGTSGQHSSSSAALALFEPRILDFGLARHTADGSAAGMTQTGQFVGTLPWSSPEQAEGQREAIDLRSDVYSLGVVLYQLLTGQFPYPVVGPMREVLDHIARAEPGRPSALRPDLDDDVDTIVLKCLSKNPERRYQSAGELAADVRHWLAGEPINAKRDSTLYVLRKTLRRHRIPVAVGSVFALVVMTLTIVLAFMYRHQVELRRVAQEKEQVANRESERATRSAEDAREKLRMARDTAMFVVDEVSSKLKNVVGTSEVQRSVLTAAYEKLNELHRERTDDPLLAYDLVVAHGKLAMLAKSIGERQQAREHLEEAERMVSGLIAGEPQRLQLRRTLGTIYLNKIDLMREPEEIRAAGETLVNLAQQLIDESHSETEDLRLMSLAHERLAVLARTTGAAAAREEHTQRMHELKAEIVARKTDDARGRHELAIAEERLAEIAKDKGDLDAMQKHVDRAVAIREALVAAEARDPAYLRALSQSYEQLAVLAMSRKDEAAHEDWAVKAFKLKQQLVELEPRHPLYQHDVAIIRMRLGHIASKNADWDTAATHYREAITILSRLTSAEPDFPRYHDDAAAANELLASVQEKRKEWRSAAEHLVDAARSRVALLKISPNDQRNAKDLGITCAAVSRNLVKLQDAGDNDTPLRLARDILDLVPNLNEKTRATFESLCQDSTNKPQ